MVAQIIHFVYADVSETCCNSVTTEYGSVRKLDRQLETATVITILEIHFYKQSILVCLT